MLSSLGEQNGYNIPEVSAALEVSKWFSDADHQMSSSSENGNVIAAGDLVKRLTSDAYMCFYQSTEVMMYQ